MCLLFCNVDGEGRISDSLLGERVIPMQQYDYFFYLMKDRETVMQELPHYRIVNGQLTLEG